MNFRLATLDDIELLLSMRKQLLLDEGQIPENDMDEELRTFFATQLADGRLVQWIVEEGADVMATGGIQFIDFPPSFRNPSGMRGYILNMYTHPSFRKRGLAGKLLDYCIEEARSRQVIQLFLIASEMGKSLYKKYGFKETDSFMEYVLDLDSAGILHEK